MRYVIGTGWWCADKHGVPANNDRGGHPRAGDRAIRSVAFFNVWSHFVKKYTSPLKIITTDSASPVLPPPPTTSFPYEYICLDRNYHKVRDTNYNGWLRGFMMGAWYAWCCDADYIYIEQDCIVLGDDWVSRVYDVSSSRQLVFGSAYRSPIQQSLVFVPRKYIARFLAVLAVPGNTAITCERRFHLAASHKNGMGYALLPFGVGRARPIDWDAPHLYAQHWTRDELLLLGRREGVSDMIDSLFV